MQSREAREHDAEIQHQATQDRFRPRNEVPPTRQAQAIPEQANGHHNRDFEGPEWFLVWVSVPLAAFTAFLFGATAVIARDAKKSSERQLRAYPGIVGARIEIHSGKIWIELEVTNTSTTPAYKFRYGMKLELCEPDTVPMIAATEFHNMEWDMAPHSKTTMRVTDKINEKEIAAVTFSGDLILMFWGRAEYEDAFGGKRHIEFVYRCGDFRKEIKRISFLSGGWQDCEYWLCTEPEPISYASN